MDSQENFEIPLGKAQPARPHFAAPVASQGGDRITEQDTPLAQSVVQSFDLPQSQKNHQEQANTTTPPHAPHHLIDHQQPVVNQETSTREDLRRTLVTPLGQQAESYESHQQRTRVGREGILKEEYIFHIETQRIKPNPNQPRKDFDGNSLQELADSIREHGLLHPVVVSRMVKPTPTGQDVEYHLIAGERRWRAAQLARLPTLPAIIKDSTEKTRLELGLVENLQRENLNPIETALAYQRLNKDFNMNQRQIAQKVGKSVSAVANTVRLLSLPQQIQTALASNKIFEGHAKAMLMLTSSEDQLKLFETVLSRNMTVRETEQEAQLNKAARLRRGKSVVTLNPYFRELIDRMEELLGTKVSLVPKGEGGRLIIEYYSGEELDELIRKLAPEQ